LRAHLETRARGDPSLTAVLGARTNAVA